MSLSLKKLIVGLLAVIAGAACYGVIPSLFFGQEGSIFERCLIGIPKMIVVVMAVFWLGEDKGWKPLKKGSAVILGILVFSVCYGIPPQFPGASAMVRCLIGIPLGVGIMVLTFWVWRKLSGKKETLS